MCKEVANWRNSDSNLLEKDGMEITSEGTRSARKVTKKKLQFEQFSSSHDSFITFVLESPPL